MRQCLACGEPLPRIVGEKLAQKVFSLWRDVVKGRNIKVGGRLTNLLDYVKFGLADEGRPACKKHVADDANAPQVALFVILAKKHFGSDVVRGADAVGYELILLFEEGGGTEVTQLDDEALFRVDKDVLQLEVTVHDALVVDVRSSRQQLLD